MRQPVMQTLQIAMDNAQEGPEAGPVVRDATQAFMLEVKHQFDVEGAMLLNDAHRRKHEHSRP